MAYNINFNGNDLSEICRVISISRSILPPRVNRSKSIPTMNGSYYTGFKYGERIINVDIVLILNNKYDNNERLLKVDKLSNIFNTNEPVKIVLSDDPDRYVYGVIDGSTDLDKLVDTMKSTISFICYDPVIYSNKYNTFEPNSRGVFTIENNTNLESYPYISTTFNNDSTFFQATNFNGQTVLIGRPPEMLEPVLPYPTTWDDNMENPGTIRPLSDSLLPQGYFGGGAWTLVPGYCGGMTASGCTNYGTGDNWHGASGRNGIQFPDLQEFEVNFEFIFSSDSNFDPPRPEPLPPVAPPPTPENPSTTCLGTYKVSDRAGLWVRESASTSSKKLVSMEYGDKVWPTEISNGWAKVTYKNKYGSQLTYTGWCSMNYLSKVSDQQVRKNSRFDENSVESECGALHLYGFDKNGAQLFRFQIHDSSEYFESATPSLLIDGRLTLHEDPIAGKPINTQSKGENGEWEYVASGAVGRWTNMHGRLILQRVKTPSGQYAYTASINKYKDWGTIVESMSTSNAVISGNMEDLSYVGFYVGALKNFPPKKHMCLENLTIKNLKTQENVDINIPIFRKGDNLQVDFQSGSVTCNGIDYLDKLDIGSDFFNIPKGNVQMIVRTEDKNCDILVGTRDCFL